MGRGILVHPQPTPFTPPQFARRGEAEDASETGWQSQSLVQFKTSRCHARSARGTNRPSPDARQ
eukprot:6371361-Lingulodinium_polyedra.AAC.1